MNDLFTDLFFVVLSIWWSLIAGILAVSPLIIILAIIIFVF